MEQQILDTILKDSFTMYDLKRKVRILKTYLFNTFYGGQNEQTALEQSETSWLKSLPQDFYSSFNKNNVSQIITDIEAKIKQIQPLVVYLPFSTTDEACAEIGRFVRKTFSNSLIIDTKFDSKLIAGCALSFRGIYKDYSLRVRIEEKKTEILESFKKHGR